MSYADRTFARAAQAGFRVTLIANPGALLDRTAAREGVSMIGLRMHRDIAPLRRSGGLNPTVMLGCCGCSSRISPSSVLPKRACWAVLRGGWPASLHAFTCCAALSLKPRRGSKKVIQLASGANGGGLRAIPVLCNSQSVLAEALALPPGVSGNPAALAWGRKLSNGVDVEQLFTGAERRARRAGHPRNSACGRVRRPLNARQGGTGVDRGFW